MGKASRRKREARAPQEEELWTPFQEVAMVGYVGEPGETVWKNSLYTVYFRRQRPLDGEGPDLLHLSLKRNDRAVIHDWRHLQRIKNEIVGPEQEMVELYPAESRLVDTANQYHLWGVEGMALPFGFGERLVSDQSEDPKTGQRPFARGARPTDARLITQAEIERQRRGR
jgi:hypothetical protein